VEEGMSDNAAKLAEKYMDFAALVQLCDSTNNQERLEQYIHKFAEHVSVCGKLIKLCGII
jgi:nuclear pore complex protein Nup133